MSKLYIKSENYDSVKEERIQMLQEGKLLATSSMTGNAGYGLNIDSVGVSDYDFGNALNNGSVVLSGSEDLKRISKEKLHGNLNISRMVSGSDVKMSKLGMTVREAILEGKYRMDGNSLIGDWSSLWDAQRIDLTIRKALNPTIRGLVYREADTPDADATMNVSEFFPHYFEFKENDGTGQSVEMGQLMGGSNDTMSQKIYATGLAYDLKKELFDKSLDFGRVNDGIAIAEAAKKDDVAMAPIFGFSYSGAQQTPASTEGTTREELLYSTMQDAIDDVEARRDPVTNSLLNANGCSIIASPADAKHIQRVATGFAGAQVNGKIRPALSEISNIIGYEGARLVGRSSSKTYTDVPTGKAYLVVPNRMMLVAIKRRLQLNVDMNPDVTKLSRQQMAWWYAEAVYNNGIGYFIQEITLPTW